MGGPGSRLRRDALSLPRFELPSDDGRKVSHQDAAGRPTLLCLVHDPRDSLLGRLNGQSRRLLASGCLVYGVLALDVDDVALVRDQANILFTLLSDPGASLWTTLEVEPGASALVLLDAEGRETRRWIAPDEGETTSWRDAALDEPVLGRPALAWRRAPAPRET